MTYRDDRDADQARIASLEGELAQANRKIAELARSIVAAAALLGAGGGGD